MRYCPKCGLQSLSGGKICRSCGGILENSPGDRVGPQATRTSASLSSAPPSLGAEAGGGDEAPRRGVWSCAACGAESPPSFDLCWNCQRPRDGVEEPAIGVEAAVQEETAAVASAILPVGPPQIARPRCPHCNSDKLIPSGYTHTSNDGGKLQVVVDADPEAWVFKGRLSSEARAVICGECGLVQFRVLNPAEIWAHFRRGQG